LLLLLLMLAVVPLVVDTFAIYNMQLAMSCDLSLHWHQELEWIVIVTAMIVLPLLSLGVDSNIVWLSNWPMAMPWHAQNICPLGLVVIGFASVTLVILDWLTFWSNWHMPHLNEEYSNVFCQGPLSRQHGPKHSIVWCKIKYALMHNHGYCCPHGSWMWLFLFAQWYLQNQRDMSGNTVCMHEMLQLCPIVWLFVSHHHLGIKQIKKSKEKMGLKRKQKLKLEMEQKCISKEARWHLYYANSIAFQKLTTGG